MLGVEGLGEGLLLIFKKEIISDGDGLGLGEDLYVPLLPVDVLGPGEDLYVPLLPGDVLGPGEDLYVPLLPVDVLGPGEEFVKCSVVILPNKLSNCLICSSAVFLGLGVVGVIGVVGVFLFQFFFHHYLYPLIHQNVLFEIIIL